MGTDISERWTKQQFQKYADPIFSQGRGWTYELVNRQVDFNKAKDTAWFDEILSNKSYGLTRGTGVLEKVGDVWKIKQYHLTIPIPNDLAKKGRRTNSRPRNEKTESQVELHKLWDQPVLMKCRSQSIKMERLSEPNREGDLYGTFYFFDWNQPSGYRRDHPFFSQCSNWETTGRYAMEIG